VPLEPELLDVDPLLLVPLEPEEVDPLLVEPLAPELLVLVEPLLVEPLEPELLVLVEPLLLVPLEPELDPVPSLMPGVTAPPQAAASWEAKRNRKSLEASWRCMWRA
jgi:hypothetical protein